jgi:hypothetical protein
MYAPAEADQDPTLLKFPSPRKSGQRRLMLMGMPATCRCPPPTPTPLCLSI